MAATLQSSLSSLDFGDVSVGQQGSIEVVFSASDNSSEITVSGISLPAGFTVSDSNFIVTWNIPVAVNFYFNPTSATTYTGTIDVNSDASNPDLQLTPSGTGVAISISPVSYNFGITKTGNTTSQKLFTITNLDSVNSLTVSVITIPTGFVAGGTFPTLPAVIAASGTLQFGIEFSPTNPGVLSESVTVTSTGSTSPLAVPVTGTAYPPYVVGYQVPFFAATSGFVSTQVLPLADVEITSGTSDGGLSGSQFILAMPLQNLNISGNNFAVGYQDYGDMESNVTDFTVTFPAENTLSYRPITIRKIVVYNYNLGSGAIKYTINGVLNNADALSISGILNLSYISALGSNAVVQSAADILFTGSLIQLTLSGVTNTAAYGIVAVILVYELAEDILI